MKLSIIGQWLLRAVQHLFYAATRSLFYTAIIVTILGSVMALGEALTQILTGTSPSILLYLFGLVFLGYLLYPLLPFLDPRLFGKKDLVRRRREDGS